MKKLPVFGLPDWQPVAKLNVALPTEQYPYPPFYFAVEVDGHVVGYINEGPVRSALQLMEFVRENFAAEAIARKKSGSVRIISDD